MALWTGYVEFCSGQHKGSPVDGGSLQLSDLEWKERLQQMEQLHGKKESTQAAETEEEEEDEEGVDVAMFAGMFRTAMEMVEDSGELVRVD